MELRIDLNKPQILQKVTNDEFGLFVAQQWKKQIDPYTPRDTQTMQNNVRFYPFKIH